MSQQYVQAARGLYDAFNKGDLDAFEKGCSPKFMWNEAENSLYSAGNPYGNFKEVLEGVFKPTKRDFDPFRCDVEKLIDGGDYIIGTGRYRGRWATTGKELTSQFCHVLHFNQDAKLDGVQEYTDTLASAQVSGKVPLIEEARIFQPAM